MPTFGAFFIHLVALCSHVLAVPGASPGHRVRIPLMVNEQFTPNGTLDMLRAYAKYNMSIEGPLSQAFQQLRKQKGPARGSVTNQPVPNMVDSQYMVPVTLGTPGQTLYMDLDTGSSDLWVFSTDSHPEEVSSHRLYKPRESYTASLLQGFSWQIGYGDGSAASGIVYQDRVEMGGLAVDQQAVESARNVSESFTKELPVFSGILGLAFSRINNVRPRQQKTWFSNIVSQLEQPLFTSYLRHSKPGTYNFGYIDQSQYTGNITWTPVQSSSGFWKFTSSGFAVGDGKFIKQPIASIADTGTSLLLLPTNVVNSYWQAVHGATYSERDVGWVFPCRTKLPDFHFGVGNAMIKIPGTGLNYNSIDSVTCYGGIQAVPDFGDGVAAIFGDVALKAAFVVWYSGKEEGEARLGWAQSA